MNKQNICYCCSLSKGWQEQPSSPGGDPLGGRRMTTASAGHPFPAGRIPALLLPPKPSPCLIIGAVTHLHGEEGSAW